MLALGLVNSWTQCPHTHTHTHTHTLTSVQVIASYQIQPHKSEMREVDFPVRFGQAISEIYCMCCIQQPLPKSHIP